VIQPHLGLIVAVFYGLISISITVFNKAVLTHYQFNYSNTLSLGQGICSLAFLYILRKFEYISFPNLSWSAAIELKWLIVSFVGMVLTGLASLAFVNIAMYSVLRRLATVVTLFGEKYYLGISVPQDEAQSVYIMLGGALVAGWGDLEFHLLGYVLIAINCIFTAWYLLAIKGAQPLRLNVFGQILYTNIFGAPIFLVLMIFTELDGVLAYPNWTNIGFLFCFFMSSIHAFLLNWLIFMCSTINSPLTTSITGQIKNIATTVLGFVLFGGIAIGYDGIFGLTLSTIASVWYAFIKYQQSANKSLSPKMALRPIGEKLL
jgi:solute carrier family 35 protein